MIPDYFYDLRISDELFNLLVSMYERGEVR